MAYNDSLKLTSVNLSRVFNLHRS